LREQFPRGLAVLIHLTDYFTLVDADLIHEIIGIGVYVVGTVVIVEVVVVVVVVVQIVDSVNGLAENANRKGSFGRSCLSAVRPGQTVGHRDGQPVDQSAARTMNRFN
jgi:hypothetical protein